MGIYDREYYRDDGGAWGGWGGRGATPWLIGITCAVWLAQLATRDAPGGGVTAFGVYDTRLILQGEVWRLFTPIFLHSERSLLHIIFNMLILYWVGRQLEERFGSREFVTFYLSAGVFAEVVNLAVEVAGLAPFSRGLGASGAVTAALVLYAFLYPRQQVLVFFVLPMPIWLAVVIYVVMDTLGALGARLDNEPVAYVVHLGGALFGAAYHLSGIHLTSYLPSSRGGGPTRRRAQPRLRVVPPDDSDDSDGGGRNEATPPPPPQEERFEERVDRLLEKVSQYGQESLTPEERELLFRAGEHYKKRRR
jgi:membrane associated rhomboid family serine protease